MNKLLMILAVALLTTGMATALLWQQTQDEREANTALQARVTALEATLPAAPASATAGPIAETAAVAALQSAAPAADPASQQVAAMAAGLTKMMASPEYREMSRAQARMSMPRMFPHLGAELGLSPAELEKFYDLMAQQQSDLMADTMGAADSNGAVSQELQQKLEVKRKASEAELAAALGSKYAQWETYQQSLPLRRQVVQLQSRLGDGDALGDAQARQLVATLAAEKARLDEEWRHAPRPAAPATREQFLALQQEQQEQRRVESNRRMLEAAAAHLTPQQVASYKRMLEQEQEMERMMMRTLESQRAAPRQGAPAAATPR